MIKDAKRVRERKERKERRRKKKAMVRREEREVKNIKKGCEINAGEVEKTRKGETILGSEADMRG